MDFFDTLMMKTLSPPPQSTSTRMTPSQTCQDDLDLENNGTLPIESIGRGSVKECNSNANKIHIHTVCGNCCVHFNDTGGGSIHTGSLDPLYQHLGKNRIYEISMSRSPQENSSTYQFQYQNENESPNLKVCDILSSIYKLNYLNSVESHVTDMEANNNNVPLCPRCADALISLYRAHENMNQLRRVDSYISQKLSELDSFITSLISSSVQSAPNHSPSNSVPMTEEQFETEIDPGSIKIEVDYGNDDFYSEMSQSPIIEIKGEPSGTHFSSSAAQMVGPPWVYVERLRPSEINSLISQASSSVSISRRLDPKSYKRQRQLRSSAVDSKKPTRKNEASDSDSNYHPPGQIEKGKSKKKMKTKTDLTSSKKRGKKSPSKKSGVRAQSRKSKKAKPIRSSSRVATSSKKGKISTIDSNFGGLESQGQGDNTIIETQSIDSDIFKKQTEKEANSKSESAFVSRWIKNVQVPKRIKGKTGIYIDHFLRRKTVPCPCLYCPVDFQSPVERADHLRLNHVKEAFIEKSTICEPCGKIFNTHSSFNGHLPKCNQIPYGIQLPPFICSYCNKEFSVKHSRDSHEKCVHAAERSFPCTHDQCSYKATSAQRLQNHVRNMHVEREGTFCDICKRTYSSVETFKYHHKRMHTEEGRKWYAKRDAITTAKRTEMRRKNAMAITSFVCCNVDFLSRRRLMSHKVAEHGVDLNLKYICEQCGRGFVSGYNLKKHILFTHTEERPFICEQCGRSFKMIQNLKFHIKTTHSEEGRLKYNKLMRENNRKRQAIKKQVALASTGPSVGIGTNSSPNKSRNNNLFQPQEPLPSPPEVMAGMQLWNPS